MLVVGGGLLFCEGKDESLDYAILSGLVHGSGYTIIPSGGKRGLRAFIEGYVRARRYEGKLIGFRDRDFDEEPPAEPALIPLQGSGDKDIYLSHRSCVESYLLEPALIRRYWEDASTGPTWKYGDPWSLADIDQWIIEAARDIADYQAVRWGLATLKTEPRWPEIRTTWCKSSGKIPASLAFEDCLSEAKCLVVDYLAKVDMISVEVLSQRAQTYRERFQSAAFWEDHGYRIWFHGKDLQKSMQKRQPKLFSLSHFLTTTAEKLDHSAFSDLRALEQRLRGA